MDQDSNSSSSIIIIKEATSQITQHNHHLMVTRAVEEEVVAAVVVVVVAVVVAVVVVVSIQVIISRDLVEDMDNSQAVMEDNRVVMATKAMEVCIKYEQLMQLVMLTSSDSMVKY
jgi:hypothetical protein